MLKTLILQNELSGIDKFKLLPFFDTYSSFRNTTLKLDSVFKGISMKTQSVLDVYAVGGPVEVFVSYPSPSLWSRRLPIKN